VSQADLSSGTTGYRPGDLVGKAGVEKNWDDELRGNPGGQQVEVDALGRRMRVLEEVADLPGATLTLTLDRDLQEAADRALGESDGALVALDPRSGEILAMVSHPAYDPNVFARGIRRDEWRALVQDRKHPLANRAVQGQFPPGSTFKVAVATGALEQGVVTPFTGVTCTGGIPFGNHFFRCWKKGGHGSVNLHRAIVESCDVFFYQVGQRLGVDTIADYANRLGLGTPTGISLDHEKPGLIPTSEWKRARYGEPWFAGETLSVAIGQGYVLATPLQMANLIATVANGGTRYRPHFVERVESASGEVVEEIKPEVLGEAGFRKSTMLQIREALRDVVNLPNGTGKRAKLPTIEVAGKTGTSQVFKMIKQVKTAHMAKNLRDHAWFVAFAPVEAPEIAMAVLIEHAGGGGGAMAAPIAHDVADFYFALTRGRSYQLASGPAVDGEA
jgi:penicillin-binding protein 2